MNGLQVLEAYVFLVFMIVCIVALGVWAVITFLRYYQETKQRNGRTHP